MSGTRKMDKFEVDALVSEHAATDPHADLPARPFEPIPHLMAIAEYRDAIELDSDTGRGARFVVRLPREPSPLDV